PRKRPQVLGVDLNRSESTRQPACPRLSLPPPTLRECRHRRLARRLIAVDGRAIFVVAESERPKPRRPNGRDGGLQDAADHQTVGQHVVVILTPLAGQAARCRPLEDQVVLVHCAALISPALSTRRAWRPSKLRAGASS